VLLGPMLGIGTSRWREPTSGSFHVVLAFCAFGCRPRSASTIELIYNSFGNEGAKEANTNWFLSFYYTLFCVYLICRLQRPRFWWWPDLFPSPFLTLMPSPSSSSSSALSGSRRVFSFSPYQLRHRIVLSRRTLVLTHAAHQGKKNDDNSLVKSPFFSLFLSFVYASFYSFPEKVTKSCLSMTFFLLNFFSSFRD
jgi:hypothetical protein